MLLIFASGKPHLCLQMSNSENDSEENNQLQWIDAIEALDTNDDKYFLAYAMLYAMADIYEGDLLL